MKKQGTIAWNELMTHNGPAARAFYEAVCGWKFVEMEGSAGSYQIAMLGKKAVAGLMDMSGHTSLADMKPDWLTYINVRDVDASVVKATAAGGTVFRAPFDVPTVGRIAILSDAGGAMVGLISEF